jgi:hypothetical protein
MEGFPSDSNSPNKGTRPVTIISQLLQHVASIHHIDELLGWIANIMVQRLDITSVQVWAVQAYATGALRSQLRASASQHPFQATQVIESAEVGTLVERMLRDQRGMLSIPVTSVFSQYQATLFMQQNCRYWTVYFLRKDILLPPIQKDAHKGEVATPLQMVFSFFTQQPLQESHARSISFLIEQSLRIAMSRGLFSTPSEKPKETTEHFVATLVPERTQITEIEQAKNPFSSALILPEKKTRQMYNLIDGKKNIAELTLSTHMNQKEVLETLQVLVSQGHILLGEPGGNPVDISSFFQSS